MKGTAQEGQHTELGGKLAAHFEKVGECLYKYVATGMYYAFLKQDSKKKRHSLETTGRAVAKRKLADKRRNFVGGWMPVKAS